MNATGLWSPDAPLAGTELEVLDAFVVVAVLVEDALELEAAELEDAEDADDADDAEDSELEDTLEAEEAAAEAEDAREDEVDTAAATEEMELGVVEPPVRLKGCE
jgi:hypothetical protein